MTGPGPKDPRSPSTSTSSLEGVSPPRRSGVIALYVVLAVVALTVIPYVIAKGDDEHAQPSIAGGYDAAVPAPCLGAPPAPVKGPPLPATAPPQPKVAGPSFDVKQSGKFIVLSNPQGTLGGKLELGKNSNDEAPRRLHGDVDCVKGGSQEFNGTATPGQKGNITGLLGGKPVSADLKRDPPDPGAPKPRVPNSIAGLYKLSPRSTCFGGSFDLHEKSGNQYEVEAKDQKLGRFNYDDSKGTVNGDVACTRGGTVRVKGAAVDRNINNLQLLPLQVAKAKVPGGPLTTPSGLPPSGEKFTATKQRKSFGNLVAAFFIAIVVVMLVARLFGNLAVWLKEPRVMGEVVAGIALGPTLLGWIAPDVQAAIFPTDILPIIGAVANLGLILYIFLVGMELDVRLLKGRAAQAAAISNASVALPMVLGIAVALPLYEILAPDTKFVSFAIFMGVAMSITAFPVLARILVERRMLKRPVGAMSLACAAIDDITAWFLIALATAVAVASSGSEVVRTIALAVAFCLFMAFVGRPLLARLSGAFDTIGRVPGAWIVAIFAGLLLSAYFTEEIGIAVIFGGFVMGLIMPRNAGLTEDVTRRFEDLTVILLLPLFFAYTGLKTNVGLLDRSELWLIAGLLLGIAIVGKMVGAAVAARATGFSGRASAVLGTLMNTRGLTELIVLNLALEKGAISDALYAMLVLMALVTTFMAGPLLALFDPKEEFSAPVEEELDEARERSLAEFPQLPVPERAILLAPQGERGFDKLRSLAEPLARSEPPRELILARLVRPSRGTASGARVGLQTENQLLRIATDEVTVERLELIEQGIAARAMTFISFDIGDELVSLAKREEVDLLILDAQRPLLGPGVPRGDVGQVLEHAPCDVAVVIAREDQPVSPGPDSPVLVPFGGAEHDWGALELAAWIAASTGAPLKLLGVSSPEESDRVSRMLADTGLLVQQYAGVTMQPLVVEPGRDSILAAAEEAGVLLLGLSERWRDEGLGPTRSEIAKEASAPVVFVRRGTRQGALAPRTDVTRFAWSSAGMQPGPSSDIS